MYTSINNPFTGKLQRILNFSQSVYNNLYQQDQEVLTTSSPYFTALGVGISTTPLTPLHVEGTNVAVGGSYEGQVMVRTTDSYAIDKGASIALWGKTNSTANPYRPLAAIAGRKESNIDGSHRGYFQICVNQAANQLSEVARFTSAGWFGLGTTLPLTYCDISGDNFPVGTGGQISATSNDAFAIDKGGTLRLGGVYNLAGTKAAFAEIAGRKETAVGGSLRGYLQLCINPSAVNLLEAGRINSYSQLGLGTGASISAKLHVKGIRDEIQEIIQGYNTQTNSISEWRDYLDNILGSVNNNGESYFSEALGIGTDTFTESLTIDVTKTGGTVSSFGGIKIQTDSDSIYPAYFLQNSNDEWSGFFIERGGIGTDITFLDAAKSFIIRTSATNSVFNQAIECKQDGSIYMANLTGSTGGSDMRYNTGTGLVFYDTSSKKFKENIRKKVQYDWLYDIPVYTYDRKNGSRKNEIGIIAEELLDIAPEYVNMNGKGRVVGYTKSDLVPVLIKAVQDLKQEIKLLKK